MAGTSRLDKLFADLRERREAALVAYLVAGDPDAERSLQMLRAVIAGGADIVELGIPFSDPLADGQVIQEGCQRALASGTTPAAVLGMVRKLRARDGEGAPEDARRPGIVLFSCYNLILQYGLSAFAADAADAGADGVLVTDLPPEEGQAWWEAAREHALDTILLVAPGSRDDRLRTISQRSSGFLYCISRMGVTGTRSELPVDLPELVARVRRVSDIPVAVGFGISSPEHVRRVCEVADGAVVGSALVERAHSGTPDEVEALVRELKEATRAVGVAAK